MDEQRIQKQIAIYMTDKKLCEFNDKLKLAPVDYYAHVHAQGEKQEDGAVSAPASVWCFRTIPVAPETRLFG